MKRQLLLLFGGDGVLTSVIYKKERQERGRPTCSKIPKFSYYNFPSTSNNNFRGKRLGHTLTHKPSSARIRAPFRPILDRRIKAHRSYYGHLAIRRRSADKDGAVSAGQAHLLGDPAPISNSDRPDDSSQTPSGSAPFSF